MGNAIAYAALFVYPVLVVLMYRRWDTLKATFWAIAGGYMFLPVKVGVDLPVIPAFTKESIPCVVAMVCLLTIGRQRLQLLPEGAVLKLLFALSVLAPLLTAYNNPDPIVTAERFMPGLSLYDALSLVQSAYLELLPFLIGSMVVRSAEDLLRITRYLVIACLIYAPLMMLEVRLSPQLHNWIYGFFPHSFAQMMRQGGFRPLVFMGHGLLVAIFTAACALAATVLYRTRESFFGVRPAFVLLFILAMLVICKSMGALILGVVGVAALAVLRLRMINLMTAVMLTLVISYPLMSLMDVFPHDWLVEQAARQDEDRASSLNFRFRNEEALLERAMEKPLFGWGGYGRARYDDSTTDGYWIITVGNRGLVGFFALFGTAAIACIALLRASARRDAPEKLRFLMAGMALIGTIILVDQLPNASMMSFTWFLFGVMVAAARIRHGEAVSPLQAEEGEAPMPGGCPQDAPPARGNGLPVTANSDARPETPSGDRVAPSVRDHFLGR
ncbi:MAG: hypothetical protein V2I82_09640 [Halieaceae bacterium]|jgi:hypothetical protein|nr:hypothetical protein [Halieaceae bacterium]